MGTLYVVATPIGNLNDLSTRALEVLKSVSVIAAEDTRQTLKLLNHFDFHTKLISYHKYNEEERKHTLLSRLEKGEDIAIVTDAGTPCVSDPGYVLVKAAREANIPVIGIPGCSASVLALSISGLDSSKFSFIGFLSQEKKRREEELHQMQESAISTFILYESPKRIVALIQKLKETFPESLVFLGSDLTKLHERGFYGTIEDVYEQVSKDEKIEKGEYVLVLQKKKEEKKKEEEKTLSLEAMLLDFMITQKKSLKEAISDLSKQTKFAKNDFYKASLNLKEIMKKF